MLTSQIEVVNFSNGDSNIVADFEGDNGDSDQLETLPACEVDEEPTSKFPDFRMPEGANGERDGYSIFYEKQEKVILQEKRKRKKRLSNA